MADGPGCSAWCGPERAAVSALNSASDNTNSAYCSFCGAVEWAELKCPWGGYRLPKASARVTPLEAGERREYSDLTALAQAAACEGSIQIFAKAWRNGVNRAAPPVSPT